MWVGYVVALVVAARCAGASINCRVACRECRDGREPRDLLTVYCAMCEECKDRRREREWLIARKQDLEKEADYLRKPELSPKVQRTNSDHNHECPPACYEPKVPSCPPCPAIASPLSLPDLSPDIPYGCPTPPPCEEEVTTTPRPTCPPIPHCVKKRPTLPSMPHYLPGYQHPVPQQLMYQSPHPQQEAPHMVQPSAMAPMLPCTPCANMCPCPQDSKSNGESVIIGIPSKLF